MRRWIESIIGRWMAQRIRTKAIGDAYRTYMANRVSLENGATLWDSSIIRT
jgi:hypothetical protein